MDFAFSFDCPLSLAEILERLQALGPWTWHERDSAWFGNIASARTQTVMLDVIESGGNELGGNVDAGNGQQFALSVRGRFEHPVSELEWVALKARIRDQVLPALGASNVHPTEPID